MNTHEHVSIEVLADYAEGLLGDADATAVAEHLASCADCQAEADLLVSVSTILAADDPGPMPAHFAARIDAALADLAAAEPVTPKRVEATTVGEGAAVIDLASRRRIPPAARVTSVAASLVLLIGGVALGMQALDTTDAGDPGDSVAIGGPGASATPTSSARYLAYALSAKQKPKGDDAERLKDGSIVDKRTGAKFLKSGKVLFPDGVVVVPKADGGAEVRTYDVQSGKTQRIAAFRQDETRPTVTVPPPASTPAGGEGPKASPTPTPEPPAPRATPDSGPRTAVAESDPYITNSGDTYTPENFAVKVQALLRAAGETADGSAASGSTSNSTDQNRVSSGAVRSDDAAAPTRGPAPAEVESQVKRCASQLGLSDLLAGDAGFWRSRTATILVTRSASEPNQAVGYVLYGDCTSASPATKADVQWEMRVDFPSAEEPAPSPSTTNSTTNTVTPSVRTSTVTPSTVTGTPTNSVSSSTEQ